MRVVIADDSKVMRPWIRGELVSIGYEVVGEAKDGKEAIRLVDATLPDVVILDVAMREMNGDVAAEHIRRKHPSVGIIFVTSQGQNPIRDLAKRIGAQFLVKPYSGEQLRRKLRVFRGSEAEIEEASTSGETEATPSELLRPNGGNA